MNSLKIAGNINNTILEVSGDDFHDLKLGEFQVESDYDFPTGQPVIYYRWNGDQVSGFVEANDENTINLFRKEEGVLEGLDLEPFITTVVGGDFLPNTTKEIIINGLNFSPFTTVDISGDGNFVNTIYFDSPQQLRASVTVNGSEGLYNLIALNSELNSKESGYDRIVVKAKTSIDLRTTLVSNMGMVYTDGEGITIDQDSEKGISIDARTSSWNRGVLFTSYMWNRSEEITFEVIFTKGTDVNFMVGIASASINVNTLTSAYYKQEIGMFHNNNKLTAVYGGGNVNNWSQGIGKTIIFTNDKYYKLKLENSGGNQARCSILEVNPNDWDDEVELHSWVSKCPADDELLMPFVIPQAANGTYYITGFRY